MDLILLIYFFSLVSAFITFVIVNFEDEEDSFVEKEEEKPEYNVLFDEE